MKLFVLGSVRKQQEQHLLPYLEYPSSFRLGATMQYPISKHSQLRVVNYNRNRGCKDSKGKVNESAHGVNNLAKETGLVSEWFWG